MHEVKPISKKIFWKNRGQIFNYQVIHLFFFLVQARRQ